MATGFQRLGLKIFLLEQFGIGPEAAPLVDGHVVRKAKREEKARHE
jgi:hypothetical protein